MNTKYITCTGIWKPALKKFTDELNIALGSNWVITDKQIEFYGLFKRKYLIIFELTKSTPMVKA